MDTLSALVPPVERLLVRTKLAQLRRDAATGGWPTHHQPCSGIAERVSTVVTAIAPQLPQERLSLVVRYGLWSIMLDDQIDGPVADPAALDRLRDAVAAVTAGHPAGRGDPLMRGLAAIIKELSRYDRTGAMLVRFGAALRDAVAAGIDHALLGRAVRRGMAQAPTAERYLQVAARTVNYRSFAYAMLAVVIGGLSSAALDRLEPALGHAAHAVRLGNDLRSVTRDRAESTLNVLSLRTAAGAPVTPRYVLQEMDRHLQAHHDELDPLTEPAQDAPDLSLPARTLARSLRLSVGLYRLTDLR